MTAEIAPTRTAAAAKSFTFLILSCFSGDIKSAIFSRDEFINSSEKTTPITMTKTIHSVVEILKKKPAILTQIVAKR